MADTTEFTGTQQNTRGTGLIPQAGQFLSNVQKLSVLVFRTLFLGINTFLLWVLLQTGLIFLLSFVLTDVLFWISGLDFFKELSFDKFCSWKVHVTNFEKKKITFKYIFQRNEFISEYFLSIKSCIAWNMKIFEKMIIF